MGVRLACVRLAWGSDLLVGVRLASYIRYPGMKVLPVMNTTSLDRSICNKNVRQRGISQVQRGRVLNARASSQEMEAVTK